VSNSKAKTKSPNDLKTVADMISPGMPGEITDCWNTIGVEGDRSCRELEKNIHCRNCPVYASAGLQMLNRPLPADYRQERTEYFAVTRKSATGSRTSLVIFRVGLEWLGLPTQVLQEVVEHSPVHSVPHRRHGVLLGLVNVRGELLPCVSVGRLLGLDPGASAEQLRTFYDRLLVIVWEGKRLLFTVDEVYGIHRFQSEDLTQPPTTLAKAALTFTQGIFPWQEKMVGLLEPELLFSTLNRSLS
jgi:chemotaxis-related protein WspD